jgi:hypothetical protein
VKHREELITVNGSRCRRGKAAVGQRCLGVAVFGRGWGKLDLSHGLGQARTSRDSIEIPDSRRPGRLPARLVVAEIMVVTKDTYGYIGGTW